MKYWFDGKMHTVSGKVTNTYIYSKNTVVYRSNFGTLSNTPKNAIRRYIIGLKRRLINHENDLKDYINESNIEKKKILRQIKKTEKLIKH